MPTRDIFIWLLGDLIKGWELCLQIYSNSECLLIFFIVIFFLQHFLAKTVVTTCLKNRFFQLCFGLHTPVVVSIHPGFVGVSPSKEADINSAVTFVLTGRQIYLPSAVVLRKVKLWVYQL